MVFEITVAVMGQKLLLIDFNKQINFSTFENFCFVGVI